MNIAMLVSGGVDSSVALELLKDEGHTITAFYLKIWLEDETAFLGDCPWEDDLKYVRAVCEQLGVPLEVVPLQKEYHERVISYALAEVRAGRTPNPDVMCNSFIKFGAFLEYADRCGLKDYADQCRHFDKVATGHYAQVRPTTHNLRRRAENGGEVMQNEKFKMQNKDQLLTTHYSLLTSRDSVKDQTYFLSRLTQEQLSRALFPLGGYTKTQVREMAREWNLPTKDRPDSQGLCFLGKINYRDFLRHHLGEREGDIVSADTGEVVAHHTGHWFYTIGQRHGLNLSGGPWYVTGKNIEKNIISISHRLKMTTVERDEFEVSNFRFLSGDLSFPRRRESSIAQSGDQKSWIPASAGMTEEGATGKRKNIFVKIRHGEKRYPCSVEFLDDKKTRLRVKLLEDKERGIAPGQFAVLYNKDVCLGSGVID